MPPRPLKDDRRPKSLEKESFPEKRARYLARPPPPRRDTTHMSVEITMAVNGSTGQTVEQAQDEISGDMGATGATGPQAGVEHHGDMLPEHSGTWESMYTIGKRAVATILRLEPDSGLKLRQSALWKTRLTLRSLCSGIGAVEEAVQYLNAAINDVSEDGDNSPHLTINCNLCHEKHGPCNQYLLRRHCQEAHEQHAFFDMLDWLPPDVRAKVREIEESKSHPFQQLRDLMMTCPLLPKAPCAKHPFRPCSRLRADVDFTGTPCPDYASLGLHANENGDSGKVLLIYARLILEDEPAIALHENVTGFKSAVLVELLQEYPGQ
jgi:hypothetical protein